MMMGILGMAPLKVIVANLKGGKQYRNNSVRPEVKKMFVTCNGPS